MHFQFGVFVDELLEINLGLVVEVETSRAVFGADELPSTIGAFKVMVTHSALTATAIRNPYTAARFNHPRPAFHHVGSPQQLPKLLHCGHLSDALCSPVV
jgi:hypothetical protein